MISVSAKTGRIVSSEKLKELRKKIMEGRDSQKVCITIPAGTCGLACGTQEIIDAFRAEMANQKLNGDVSLKITGCHGFCQLEPTVLIFPQGLLYQRVALEDVPEIVKETVKSGKVVERLCYVEPKTKKKVPYEKNIPFYKKQQRIVLGDNRFIDPTSIEDYIAAYGPTAKPFIWRKREVKGSQLKNTIVNLCN